MSEKPTYTYEGVTYTELVLWKAKTDDRTYFSPAFIEQQLKESAEKEGLTLISVEKATEDEATAYGEGFYEGLSIGRQGQSETTQNLG